MKKTITPAVKEHSVYFSDFTGKCFGIFEPEVVLNINFSYGSKHDGTNIQLHLTDHEILPILQLIKTNMSPEAKSSINIP